MIIIYFLQSVYISLAMYAIQRISEFCLVNAAVL